MSNNRSNTQRSRQNEGEREPLLRRESQLDSLEGGDSRELVQFDHQDKGNPKEWKYREKLTNIGVIASMAILTPLASSMFTPGINQIADGLDTTPDQVIACKYLSVTSKRPLANMCSSRHHRLRDHARSWSPYIGTSIRDVRTQAAVPRLLYDIQPSSDTQCANSQYRDINLRSNTSRLLRKRKYCKWRRYYL